MDHFGIGSALRGAARIYFQSARNTGRTVSLVESAKNGDRLVFTNSREAERVKRLCLERGVTVYCVVIPVEHPEWIFTRGRSAGRTLFDHTWVEQYYPRAIEGAGSAFDQLQRESSGRGAEHQETPFAAEEEFKLWKW